MIRTQEVKINPMSDYEIWCQEKQERIQMRWILTEEEMRREQEEDETRAKKYLLLLRTIDN